MTDIVSKAPHARAAWHDAYDAQMALWRWYRTPFGKSWIHNAWEISANGHSQETQSLIARLWDGEAGRLLDCDPIYVSEEMCELVEVARESFQPEPLLETDLVTPRGFLWFDRPMLLPDKRMDTLAIRAASWSREYASTGEATRDEAMERLHSPEAWQRGDRIRYPEMDKLIEEGLIYPFGVGVTLYADRDFYLDTTNVDLEGSTREGLREQAAAVSVVPFHTTSWHFNQSFEGNDVDELGFFTGAHEWWTLLQTTFRLMQQKIAATHLMRLNRQARREASRKLGYEPEVVVVKLRRESAAETYWPSGEEANYSHRFIVSGHWRDQWYPSEQIHRQIWISPYVKGPEDKPLIVRPRRVFQWER